MVIKPGKYRTALGEIVIIENKQEVPIPMWRGRLRQSKQSTAWLESGMEVSGHHIWDLVEIIEEKDAIIEGD